VAGTNPFDVEGVIVGVLQPGVFRVALSNGHQLIGYVVRRERDWGLGLGPSDRVRIECTPYDLSKGRVRPGKTDQS
jgi:translation initiation factor IF-1